MVKVLVTLPIRWCTLAAIDSSEERSATPQGAHPRVLRGLDSSDHPWRTAL